MDRDGLRAAVAAFLKAAGVDPADPHLQDTPARVADAWADELIAGYEADPAEILAGFDQAGPSSDGAVIVTGVHYVSVCPHHLLPYQGVAHLAYVPGGREVGFSKLVRLVEALGARLVLQEDLGRSLAEALVTHLGARGAAVTLEAQQMCMALRGVRRHQARVTTTARLGVFEDDASDALRAFRDAVAAWRAGPGTGAA